MNKESWNKIFLGIGVPVNLAEQAADLLSRQDAGELPVPLEENDLHIVRSAHTWAAAKGAFDEKNE